MHISQTTYLSSFYLVLNDNITNKLEPNPWQENLFVWQNANMILSFN